MTGGLPFTSSVPRPAPDGSRPAAKFNSVVLPQPEGPTIETNSPGAMFSENSDTASELGGSNTTDTLSKITEPGAGFAAVPAPAFACAGFMAMFIVCSFTRARIRASAAPCPTATFLASTFTSMILFSRLKSMISCSAETLTFRSLL